MANVAGVDGTPGGWAVVLSEGGRGSVRQVTALRDIVDGAVKLDIVAVDVPIAVLDASSWEDACSRSRDSAPNGKAISKQAFAIVDKIREVDGLLRSRPELR